MGKRVIMGCAMAMLAIAAPARARVMRMVVDAAVAPAFEGAGFGDAGTFRTVRGHLVGEVDPAQVENARITDIALAPRNAAGRVEYTADFLLLLPTEPMRGSGFLQVDLVNRGRTLGLAYNVGGARGPEQVDPGTRAAAGDGWTMRRGDAVLYIGWQGDLMPGRDLLRLQAPVATDGGRPITGPVRVTFVPERREDTVGIAGGGAPQVAYPAADTGEAGAVLRHRGSSAAEWVVVPRAEWAFASCADAPFPGQPSPVRICARDGLDPSQDYDLQYTAQNPVVLGLGLAAIRDAASFFRHDPADGAGTANPLAGLVRHVVAVGESQDGNLMRNLVQTGFNQDEAGRQVFDGMMAHLSGKRTPINFRFAAPGATTTMFEGPLLPGHEMPLTWQREPDPFGGPAAGLMDRCTATQTCPKVMNTFTSTEYRQYDEAYLTVDPAGTRDLALPENVRAYFLAGSQHGTLDSQAAPIGPGACRLARNNGPNAESQRALLVAMEEWIGSGRAPPASQVATVGRHELAAPADAGFPVLPGVEYPQLVKPILPIDFGPGYDATDQSGVIGHGPVPRPTGAFRPLVPRVDADGNETSGVRPTALQAPVGTYTGWNTRRASPGELCGLSGGYIGLARTRAERVAAGDPRLSLEERYRDHAGYVEAVRRAAASLRDTRLLLPEDANRLGREAEASAVLR